MERVPREVNTEADRLADGDARGFMDENRVVAAFGQVRWLVLDRLMEAGLAFQQESERIRHRTEAGVPGVRAKLLRKLAGEGLRTREPW